jgi:hypothetical protein
VNFGSDQHSNNTMTVEVAAGSLRDAPASEVNCPASALLCYTRRASEQRTLDGRADSVLLLSCAMVQRSKIWLSGEWRCVVCAA